MTGEFADEEITEQSEVPGQEGTIQCLLSQYITGFCCNEYLIEHKEYVNQGMFLFRKNSL